MSVHALLVSLAPHRWRELTPDMLARCCVGALDHAALSELIRTVDTVAEPEPPAPAESADERVLAVVEALEGLAWRGWSATAVAEHVLAAIVSWQAQRDELDADLLRLLGDG